MFNATNKQILMMAIFAIMTSCGSGDKSISQQMQLYQEAEAALTAGNATKCITLLDSLDKWHPSAEGKKDTEAMRMSMALRPKAVAVTAEADIAACDSIIAANRSILETLKPQLKYVTLPNVEGYYVAADAYNPHFLNGIGLSGRVTDIGEFYIVSSLNPAGGLKHVAIAVKSGAEEAMTPEVKYDGALNYRISGSEMITFTPSQSSAIGEFVSAHKDTPINLSFVSENGKTKSVKLSVKDADAIALAYNYAKAVNAMRDATIAREKYQKILELANIRSNIQQ